MTAVRFASRHLMEPGDLPLGGALAGQRFENVEVVLDELDAHSPDVDHWIERTLRPRSKAVSVVLPKRRFETVIRDVNVRLEAEKQDDDTWVFRVFDRDGKLVSDRYSHRGPDFEAGRSFEKLVERWSNER